jgi:hypothetical protein
VITRGSAAALGVGAGVGDGDTRGITLDAGREEGLGDAAAIAADRGDATGAGVAAGDGECAPAMLISLSGGSWERSTPATMPTARINPPSSPRVKLDLIRLLLTRR